MGNACARPQRRQRVRRRRPMLATLALALWVPFVLATLSWSGPGGGAVVGPQSYIMPLAPLSLSPPAPGWLGHPINFGYRCTLVDAAAVLDYYGSRYPQALLALRLSDATRYAQGGPPWWAYVAPPGGRSLLDTAIERVAREAGLTVTSQTTLGLSFSRAVAAIAYNRPVILNVLRTPNGTVNHSLLAYGYDTRDGRALLLAIDPNTQVSYWIGPDSLWSETITTTFITPANSAQLV